MSLTISESTGNISPEALYGLLSKKGLLPDMLKDPFALGHVASGMKFFVVHDGEDVFGVALEFMMEPGVLGLIWTKERGRYDRRVEDLQGLAPKIHDRWFRDPSIRRVDCRHPVSHVQTGRMLRAIGFVRETNSCGLRDAMVIRGFPVPIHVWGLLRADVAPDKVETHNDKMSQEVANAVE